MRSTPVWRSTQNTHFSQSLKREKAQITYFGWSRVRFGQVGGAGSAGPEVAAAVAVLDAAAGPTAAVAAAVELPAVAARISAAAVAE